MQNVTANYLSAVNHYTRNIRTRVYFNDSAEPIENELISVTVSEKGISGDSLLIGDLCTNQAEITFTMPETKIPLQGGKVKIEHGVMVDGNYEWVNIGTYYITDIERTDGTKAIKITCYDSSTRLEKKYVPTITFPATIEAVANDVLSQCNLTMEATEFPNVEIEEVAEECEEMLCLIAGLMGKSVKVNRNDKIEFYWWNDSGLTIERSVQYSNGFKRNTDNDIVISSLTSGTEELPITVGTGYGITFTNPYMTEEILVGIYENVNGFAYTPATIKYRGNPILEVGDIVSVIDNDGNVKKVLISDHTITLTGMYGQIESVGNTEENLALSKTPTDKKLEQMRSSMQIVMKNITEKLVGVQGGHYFIDYDEDGFPCGWTLMNTPSLRNDTKLWKMSMGGFGYSEDGGKTFKNFAFDMDGNFYANAVNAGVLNGECFSLDLDNGTVLIGNRDSNGEISNPAFSFDPAKGLNINITEKVTVTDITPEYGKSDSSDTEPTEWFTTKPTVTETEYLWMREKYTYSDGKTKTNEAYVISSPDIEIGGRNLLLNSSFSKNLDKWTVVGNTYFETRDGRKCYCIVGGLGKSQYIYQQFLDKIKKDDVNQVYTFSVDVCLDNYVAGTEPFVCMYIYGYYDNEGTSKAFTGTKVSGTENFYNINNQGWKRLTYSFKIPKTKVTTVRACIYGKDFTGYLYFRDAKLELGNKATDWTPAPEDVDNAIDGVNQNIQDATDGLNQSIQDTANQLNQNIEYTKATITTEYSSAIQTVRDEINLRVGSVESIVDANGEKITSLETRLQVTDGLAQLTKTTTETLQSAVDGKVSQEDLEKYIRFDVEHSRIEIGTSTSNFKTMLTNEELAFYEGDVKVAWISNNELHVRNAIITTGIRVGKFSFVDEGDLGFSLMLVEGVN